MQENYGLVTKKYKIYISFLLMYIFAIFYVRTS